jgi:NAD(P)-dependent dehydrogenase (short-subunit alcohol dehydrogenase family)
MRLRNKVALVTGAGSDIGCAVALLFSQEGAKVVVADKVSKEVQNTVDRIRTIGGETTAALIDISDPLQVKTMMTITTKTYGGIDILYNIPGELCPSDFQTEDAEKTWDAAMAVSLRSVFLCCKYGLPELLNRGGGVMINQVTRGMIPEINSLPSPILCAYHSAKTSIITLTNKIAYAFGPAGIRALSVMPGIIKTTSADGYDGLAVTPTIIGRIPLRRFGTPDDVAQAALFFASDEASFVSGTALWVDGAYMFTHRGSYS